MQAITAFYQKKKTILVRVLALALPVLVLLGVLAPTVFAQTTYVITDGDQVKVYTTYSSNPAEVLDRAGVELSEDDTYTTVPGNGVSEITVQRNQNIRINYRGEVVETSSYGESLEELLTRLEIPTTEDVVTSLPLNTETFDGMEVTVDCVLEMKQTYTVEIPYEVVECNDPSLPVGTRLVKVQGVPGELCKTAKIGRAHV